MLGKSEKTLRGRRCLNSLQLRALGGPEGLSAECSLHPALESQVPVFLLMKITRGDRKKPVGPWQLAGPRSL